MNGSRSNPTGSKASSLDALSRTIEGLEARIEGLMGGRDSRAPLPQREPQRARLPDPVLDERRDPLAEIRERQRALELSRTRSVGVTVNPGRPSERRTSTPADPYRAPAPAARDPNPAFAATPTQAEPALKEISEALAGLRRDLKTDIADSVAHEIRQLRSEMQGLATLANDRFQDDAVRDDLARLAQGISHLSQNPTAGDDSLRGEFEELRSLMDGLAREDTVREIDTRWTGIESRLGELDTDSLRDDLGRLAFRLDDIKTQIGSMDDSHAIRALEEKLITVATALEHIGTHMDPGERALREQFAGLDLRLDEISRAIVAGNRAAPATDNRMAERLEDRLVALSRQIDGISQQPPRSDEAADEIAQRLEFLADRVEQLAKDQTVVRLEERLDYLADLLNRPQQPAIHADVTDALYDISRKMEALESGSANDHLTQRLDRLAYLIETREAETPADHPLLRNLDNRLAFIADRLDETLQAPASDSALRSLEEQISHLSGLMSSGARGIEPDDAIAGRLTAIEDYMATSDEYIIEAARHAAEAVMANFAGQQRADRDGGPPVNVEAFAALADSLRHLEDISRMTEERSHRTLESLQDTLLEIADRLDRLHHDGAGASAQAPQQSFASAAPAFAGTSAFQSMAPAPLAPEPVLQSQPAMASAASAGSDVLEAETMTADAATSAIADSDDQVLTVSTETGEADGRRAKAAKPSLLAGLGKRLLPGARKDGKEDEPAPVRQTVNPTPSLDPADVLPPEEANELLEPGSGAPDVRKILERVRAARTHAAEMPAGEADRTDYIAAARRAAQAAAEEAGNSPSRTSIGELRKAAGGQSVFNRYRRPILMAAGAVLLALMAMPLVKSMTRSEASAPVIEAPAQTPAPTTPSQEQGAIDAPDAMLPASAEASVETHGLLAPATDAGPAASFAAMAPQQDEIEAFDGVPASELTPVAAPEGVQVAALSGAAPSAANTNPEVNAAVVEPEPQDDVAQVIDAAGPSRGPADAAPVDAAAEAPATAAYEIPASLEPASLAKAAAEGDPIALFEIAARYTEGRGFDIDLAQAAIWYQHAADKGFVPALYRLGNLYEKGTGVPRSIEKATQLYEEAAAKGNASAMHNLAVLYASGAAGAQDYGKAVEWFAKAAQYGVSDSQFNLAILYARGNGTTQDLEGSYKWFSIAAKDGDKDAAQKREDVAKAMTPAQRTKVDAEVAAWKPTPLDVDANSVNAPDEWVGKGTKTASIDMKKVIHNVQAILNNNGFDAGPADGVMGAKTTAAIKAFQTSIGQEPNGQINDQLVKELLARNK